MFENINVVQSAISAFNNAALAGPAFLWWAILSLPLMAVVWVYGNDLIEKIGWSRRNLNEKCALYSVAFAAAWVVLFGGNYGVLRDWVSVLPYLTAVILFLSSMFITSHTNHTSGLRQLKQMSRLHRWATIAILFSIMVIIGLSDTHTWWSPFMQVGAAITGYMIGRYSHTKMRPVSGSLLILMTITTAILMQPEFFRFGMLGGLTLFHLAGLLSVGVAATATVALRNVQPRAKISHSVYIKLKWLARFVVALCAVLFVMTESVPMFFAILGVCLVSFALSIYNSEHTSDALGNLMFAIALFAFGVITTLPVISAFGVLLWKSNPHDNFWREIRFLL